MAKPVKIFRLHNVRASVFLANHSDEYSISVTKIESEKPENGFVPFEWLFPAEAQLVSTVLQQAVNYVLQGRD